MPPCSVGRPALSVGASARPHQRPAHHFNRLNATGEMCLGHSLAVPTAAATDPALPKAFEAEVDVLPHQELAVRARDLWLLEGNPQCHGSTGSVELERCAGFRTGQARPQQTAKI